MTQAEQSAAVADAPSQDIGISSPRVNGTFTPEEMQQVLERLREPFDPELVEWRVTNTSGSRGQVVAYADPRAYTDRLNELLTPAGWTREYFVQTVQNFEAPRKDGKSTIITAKVMVTSKVTIHGLGAHSGTGEEWAIDENALTRAEAQAFKRACVCFGLGRYFYDLPRTWVNLDQNRRPVELPALPEWALPVHYRGKCGAKTTAPAQRPGMNGRNGQAKPSQSYAGAHTNNGNSRGRGLYWEEMRQTVEKLTKEIGFSLTRWALQCVASVDELDALHGQAQMTAALDKLTDLARGVARLRAAVERAGPAVYTRLCEELNLASDSIDDIPNREVLRQLVMRMESAAADPDGNSGTAAERTDATNPTIGKCTSIGDLRGRLLMEARRVATAQRKSLASVIAEASRGAFTLSTLLKLTDADSESAGIALQELTRIRA
jgi:hypothetical protein